MNTLEVLQPQNGLDSLDSSEYSIIPDPLLNGLDSENGLPNGNYNLTNLHSALLSATPDLSLEELQSRLADVVEDNATLKESLKKNNEMMQQQLQSISAWHSELTTTMSRQQLDLTEAKKRIKELEKENGELLSKCEEKNKTSVKDNISPLSDEDVDFEIINRKEFKNRVDESKLKEEAAKVSSLMQIIEQQNTQIESLKKSIANEATNKELLQEQNAAKSYESIQQLEKRLEELEQSLTVEQTKLEQERSSHSETKKMFAMVQTNYDRVTKLLQIQARDERDKVQTADDIEREMDTKMYLEQIDKLTAKLFDTEQKLQAMQEEFRQLDSEMEALRVDSETIPILKAQVDLYKMDLETATLARDAASAEVNRLTQQLHEVGSASCADSCHASMADGVIKGSKGKGRKKPLQSQKKEMKPPNEILCVPQKNEMLSCPICNTWFTNLQMLETHCSTCGDQS